jgi:hypothetical protein
MGLLSATEQFSDGSSITPINRDELKYEDSIGRFVTVYFGLTGGTGPFDRLLDAKTVLSWDGPERQGLTAEDKRKLLQRLKSYKKLSGLRLGVRLREGTSPVAFDDSIIDLIARY